MDKVLEFTKVHEDLSFMIFFVTVMLPIIYVIYKMNSGGPDENYGMPEDLVAK